MKINKKILLMTILAFTLSACGGNNQANNETQPEVVEEVKENPENEDIKETKEEVVEEKVDDATTEEMTEETEEETPVVEEQVEPDLTMEYEIYPKVKDLTYLDGSVNLRNGVNVTAEGLDDYTVAKAIKVFTDNKIEVVEKEDKNLPKVYVGTILTDNLAYNFIKENAEDADIFEEFDAYRILIKDDTIAIVGKDTDAAFYGLETLDLILGQAHGAVRNLNINDFSDSKYRGTIEGYYGNPWGWENRIKNLEFAGKFKSNIFVFAPKDDPYHNSQWRDLYPEEQIAEIAKVAEAGNINKNRFVWTIHPFMNNALTSDTIDEDLPILIAKFEQLYDAGVRQFGVLADDTSGIDKDAIVRVMNELSAWAIDKGDVYDLLFCPNSYTLSWNWDGDELTKFDREFPDNVQIFFTGKNVLTAINERDLQMFKTKEMPEGEVRRDPLFWLNWPVNDIDNPGGYRRIFLGPMYVAENDVKSMVGAVTNPMEHPILSQFAIFAMCDYTWNIEGFDAEKSWEDSIKYVEPEAVEEFKVFALQNTDSSNKFFNLPESEEFDLPIFEFEMAMNSDDLAKIEEKAKVLRDLYKNVYDNTISYEEKGANKDLKAELEPYTGSMKYTAEAGMKFIDAIVELKTNGSTDEFKKLRDEANEAYKTANSYTFDSIGTDYPTMTGTKRLRPNIEKMQMTIKNVE